MYTITCRLADKKENIFFRGEQAKVDAEKVQFKVSSLLEFLKDMSNIIKLEEYSTIDIEKS